MNKEIEKLLFNPIRLKTISFLMTVETCNFKVLLEITDSTKGNLSIQLKKLNEAGLIKIEKYFQKSYPTTCLLYTSPSPRDRQKSRMPSSA